METTLIWQRVEVLKDPLSIEGLRLFRLTFQSTTYYQKSQDHGPYQHFRCAREAQLAQSPKHNHPDL